jgi:hypothetical protein
MDACKTVYCWVLALLVELARRNEKTPPLRRIPSVGLTGAAGAEFNDCFDR